MIDTRERLTTPVLHRFIESIGMQHQDHRRAILIEGFGDVFYVEPAMRTSTLDGVPVLILRLHEPPETPHVGGEGNVGAGTACGSGRPLDEALAMRFALPSSSTFFDDRCALCEHPSEDHQNGDEKCYTCPAARRCRRFEPKARR